MKIFFSTLICLVGAVSAGVRHDTSHVSVLELEDNSDERIGIQHIAQMTQEELVHQKFLLDVLQQINEPIVNEELRKRSNVAQNQLIDEQALYNEPIDKDMSHVIELSRNEQLLGKDEVFTIANEEHSRQMIGLYSILACSRDWETLEKNLLYARIHVNGVLLVNSLVLALRDREDAQKLFIPGLQEILPELYLDEDVIRQAKNINYSPLTKTTHMAGDVLKTQHNEIREMIEQQQKQRENINGMNSSDRQGLWMPWREWHKKMKSQRFDQAPVHAAAMSDDDDDLVLPAKRQSQVNLDDESGLELLTDDVGFKAFLQTFMSDLCLHEKDEVQANEQNMMKGKALFQNDALYYDVNGQDEIGAKKAEGSSIDADDEPIVERSWIEQSPVVFMVQSNDENDMWRANEQQTSQSQNKARLVRVGLSRNLGSKLKTRTQDSEEQIGLADTDKQQHRVPWSQISMHDNNEWSDDTASDDVQQHNLPRRANKIFQKNFHIDTYGSSQKAQLPTRNLDDENLLHVNKRRQNAVAVNQMFSRGGYKNSRLNEKEGINLVADWNGLKNGNKQATMRRPFVDTIHSSDRNGRQQDVGDKFAWNTHPSMGMPMDWNRQMAMHRQREKNVNEHLGADMSDRRIWSTPRLGAKTNLDINEREQMGQQHAIGSTEDRRPWMISNNLHQKNPWHGKEDINSEHDWARGQSAYQQAYKPTGSVNVNGARDPNASEQNMDEKFGWNTHLSMGMPMDWNRQMAMHRQRVKNIDGQQYMQTRTPKVLRDLLEVNINDQQLLPLTHRQLNQMEWHRQQNQQKPQQWARIDASRSAWNENQRLMNQKSNSKGKVANLDWFNPLNLHEEPDQVMSNRRTWKTSAVRGMGNLGIHKQDLMNQHGDIEGKTDTDRWGINNHWDIEHGSMNSWATNDNVRRGKSHLFSEHESNGRWSIRNKRPANINWDNENNLDMWHQRSRRSVMHAEASITQVRGGELLLHNLQQLVARINLEQYTREVNPEQLGWENYDITSSRHPLKSQEEQYGVGLDDRSLTTLGNKVLLEKMNEVEKRLETIIQKRIQSDKNEQGSNVHKQSKIDNEIGNTLMGKNDGSVNILNILREIIQQTQHTQASVSKLAQVSLNLKDPLVINLLRHIVHITDSERQKQLGAYHSADIRMQGVTINEVKVDKLQTYLDTKDVDLINALAASQTHANTNDGGQQVVVARQQRLNHKDFTISIDITTDRNQRVVMRTLLGPKMSSNAAQLNEQRHNFILLNAQRIDLRSGRNQIKLRSRDIAWTARDTTPFHKIYEHVMRALNNNEKRFFIDDQVQGQTCRFPHRLLLPRGTTDGMPMQMLVVITPWEDEDQIMQQWPLSQHVCGIGLNSANLDHLPLGFPLDRQIENEQEVLALPNVHMIDVKIYHDNQVQRHQN